MNRVFRPYKRFLIENMCWTSILEQVSLIYKKHIEISPKCTNHTFIVKFEIIIMHQVSSPAITQAQYNRSLPDQLLDASLQFQKRRPTLCDAEKEGFNKRRSNYVYLIILEASIACLWFLSFNMASLNND